MYGQVTKASGVTWWTTSNHQQGRPAQKWPWLHIPDSLSGGFSFGAKTWRPGSEDLPWPDIPKRTPLFLQSLLQKLEYYPLWLLPPACRGISAKPLVERAVIIQSQNANHVQTSGSATAPAAITSEGVHSKFSTVKVCPGDLETWNFVRARNWSYF